MIGDILDFQNAHKDPNYQDYMLGMPAPKDFLLLDWPGGVGPSVVNQQYCLDHEHNDGQLIHPHLPEILTKGPFIAFHYAEDYLGLLWFDPVTRRYYEQVDRQGDHLDTYTEADLETLVGGVKSDFGHN